jgi:integrase
VLTNAAVQRLKPNNDGTTREVRDGAHGLALCIYASGVRSWIIRFRRPDGRPAKLTLGPFSPREHSGEPVIRAPLTLAGARRLAIDVRRQLALGIDPAAEHQATRRAARAAAVERSRNSFGTAAIAFVRDHARPKQRRWRETASLLGVTPDLELIPGGLASRWAVRPVAEITAHDVYELIEDCRRRGVPGREFRGGSGSARSMYSTLSKFFSWLIEHRQIERNPCASVKRPGTPEARERVLSDDEIRALWAACDQVSTPFGALVRLLLLTGQRRDEIRLMKWSEIDSDLWTIPGSRTKNHREHQLPIAPMVHQILDGLPRVDSCDLVFVGHTGHTAISGFSKLKRALDAAMGPGVPPWRVHDLRRTAASGMARAGADLHVIERTLNHVSGSFSGIVGVYQKHRFADEVKAALIAWENLLAEITSGTSSGGKVVKMRRARR